MPKASACGTAEVCFNRSEASPDRRGSVRWPKATRRRNDGAADVEPEETALARIDGFASQQLRIQHTVIKRRVIRCSTKRLPG